MATASIKRILLQIHDDEVMFELTGLDFSDADITSAKQNNRV